MIHQNELEDVMACWVEEQIEHFKENEDDLRINLSNIVERVLLQEFHP